MRRDTEYSDSIRYEEADSIDGQNSQDKEQEGVKEGRNSA